MLLLCHVHPSATRDLPCSPTKGYIPAAHRSIPYRSRISETLLSSFPKPKAAERSDTVVDIIHPLIPFHQEPLHHDLALPSSELYFLHLPWPIPHLDRFRC